MTKRITQCVHVLEAGHIFYVLVFQAFRLFAFHVDWE